MSWSEVNQSVYVNKITDSLNVKPPEEAYEIVEIDPKSVVKMDANPAYVAINPGYDANDYY